MTTHQKLHPSGPHTPAFLNTQQIYRQLKVMWQLESYREDPSGKNQQRTQL